MSGSQGFVPVGVEPLRDDASVFEIAHALTTNPIKTFPARIYHEPIVTKQFFGNRAVAIADPDLVQAILLKHSEIFERSDFQQLVLRRVAGESLLTASGDTWRFHRKTASPIFRMKNLERLLPSILHIGAEIAASLLDKSQAVDVLEYMSDATARIVAEILFSTDTNAFDTAQFASDVDNLISDLGKIDAFDLFGVTRNMPRPWRRRSAAANARLHKTVEALVMQRRRSSNAHHDLLQYLIDAKNSDSSKRLSDTMIRDNLLGFLGAGYETTALMLTWTLYLLANNEEWQTGLFQEIQDVCGAGVIEPEHIASLQKHEMVLNEALRLYPPVPAIDRRAKEDVSINGFDFRRNDYVILAIYPMHRNSLWWTSPEEFDPSRFDPSKTDWHRFVHLPFGGGPHVCIGRRLAIMEGVAVLASLIKRLSFHPKTGFRPEPRSRITLRPVNGMQIRCKMR